MINALRKLFNRKPEPAKAKPKKEPLTLEQLEVGINAFVENMWDIRRLGELTSIPAVKCPVTFGGYGYVEGRTKGIKVNKRLTIVEADSDMDFSEVCLLIDGLPAMLLTKRRGAIAISIISGRDYFEELFNPSGMLCTNLEEFKQLPSAIQQVLHDVFADQYRRHVPKDAAIEKIINYQ